MFETSTNENENLMRYIELLPKNEQLEIEDRPDLYQEFEKRWMEKDLTLY